VDKGIENLLARLSRDLLRNMRITASNSSAGAIDTAIENALYAAYSVGGVEAKRDQAPCDGIMRPPGAERDQLAKCMKLAGHSAPHESADGCQWWSGADGTMLAALSRSDDAESPSESGPVLGQVDVES